MGERIDRLIACGFTPINALNMVESYYLQGKESELDDYISTSEKIYNERSDKT